MDFLDLHKLKEKRGAIAFNTQEDLAFRLASEVVMNMRLDAIGKLGLGITPNCVKQVVRGETWKHLHSKYYLGQ